MFYLPTFEYNCFIPKLKCKNMALFLLSKRVIFIRKIHISLNNVGLYNRAIHVIVLSRFNDKITNNNCFDERFEECI